LLILGGAIGFPCVSNPIEGAPMSSVGRPRSQELLDRARRGDREDLGRLLELYRNYLNMLARLQIDRRLRGRVDPSDLVQDTFLEAHRAFAAFHGQNEVDLLEWLRRILRSRLTSLVRRHCLAQRRDVRLEHRLDEELEHSSEIARTLLATESSPSQNASRREQAVVLADALECLPEHYREVIVLRHMEELSFPEVARRMERSLDSVKNLWVRALAALEKAIGDVRDA
jgi:RNA polymerase sigma-70 factor, ECF subfamily